MNDILTNALQRMSRADSFIGFHPGPDSDANYAREVVDEPLQQEEGETVSEEVPNDEGTVQLSTNTEVASEAIPSADIEALIARIGRGGPAQSEVSEAEEIEETATPLDDSTVEALLGPAIAPQTTHPNQSSDITESQDGYQPQRETFERPQNLIIRDETLRFSAAKWFEKTQEKTIILAGIGGIGSWVAFLLAKLRPKAIYMYDPDVVELVNMAGQLYRQEDVGKAKVDAIADTIRSYTGYGDVFCYQQRYDGSTSLVGDIMICGFDNMLARAVFYDAWWQHVHSKPEQERRNCLFIDGRLTAEELQILCIQGDDEYSMTQYSDRFSFSDYQAENEVCSFKQTAFMANMIGGLIVNLFVNFCANQCDIAIPRALPFFTQYQADMLFFNVEK